MTLSPETNVWAAGLPLTATRLLSEAEVGELRSRAARFQRHGILALLGIPLALLVFFILAPLAPRPAAGSLALPLIAITVVTPWLVLTARDCLILARDLRRDVRTGRADRFEGHVGQVIGVDGTLRRLVKAGLLHRGAYEPQWLEILPESGLVWSANGAHPKRWVRASYAETANLPTYASVAAEWVETVDASREDAFHVGRRDLSEPEVTELRRHMRRIIFKPAVVAVFLNAWLIVALWALYSGARRLEEGHQVFLFAVLVAVTVQVDLGLIKCVHLGIKFARDLRLRVAVIVRSPALVPQQAGQALLPADEFLGASGVLWTRSGTPAPWRLMPGR